MLRLIALILLLGVGVCSAEEQSGVHLTVITTNVATVKGDTIGQRIDQRTPLATVVAQGRERSECVDYGRSSSASATGSARVLDMGPTSTNIQLDAAVKAFGGHYRTCVACVFACVGIFGHDTSASALAAPSALVTITFDADFPPTDYRLDISTLNESGGLITELKDGAGGALPLKGADGRPTVLHGRPGATYFLSVKLPLEVKDAGGCCGSEKSAEATLTAGIRLERAPILAAAQGQFVPFIAGGRQTKGFPYVGAIRIDGELHCTATVIGPATVLTAAHCVYGFESRLLKSSVFLLGTNIEQPDLPLRKIVGFAYPVKADGFAYDPKNYDNDVAVVYLDSSPGMTQVKLHAGKPAWTDVILNKVSLTFVGFGYDLLDRQPVAGGIKREASWRLSEAQEKTVRFGAADIGTCKGDSGGPAFLIDAGEITQMAITSGSETATCRDGGVETRVDFYRPWIAARVR